MNGPADVGGAHGFGPVEPEPDEPTFHEPWERDAFALTLAMGATGLWTLDRARYARESLPRLKYYGSTYYRIWFAALERLCAEVGALEGTAVAPRKLEADAVRAAMARGTPADRDGPANAFSAGDRVRVRPMRPSTHTRAPTYLRGKVGRIDAVHGTHVFPDASAHGEGDQPVPLYNVAFEASEVWGADTTASEVRADLFEPYLERA